jgi:hypothetical protein
MLAKLKTFSLVGIDALPVGLPRTVLVGTKDQKPCRGRPAATRLGIHLAVVICAVVGCGRPDNSGKKRWPLGDEKTMPAKVTVLTGTTFLCGNVRCRLLGVRESNDPAVRQLAEKFTQEWFKSVGNCIGMYNDSNPLLDKDGTAVVWIRGYDCFLSCLNEELVRAGLVDLDDLPSQYAFTEPRKSGDEIEDWKGVLRKAEEGHQKGEELRVLFKWPQE